MVVDAAKRVTAEEVEELLRRYADQHRKGWALVVVTIHDAEEMKGSLKIHPRDDQEPARF